MASMHQCRPVALGKGWGHRVSGEAHSKDFPFSAVCGPGHHWSASKSVTGAHQGFGRVTGTLPRAQSRAQHIPSSYYLLAVVSLLLFCSLVVCMCL